MHRVPPLAASFLLLVATVAVLPMPANSFAFQATTTSLSVRPPIQVAASFARQLSLSSSQHSRSHHHNGKIALAMSSDDAAAAIDAASNANEASNNGGGTASIPNEVFNLVKSIVGAGVLSLPAGEFWDITIIDIFFIE